MPEMIIPEAWEEITGWPGYRISNHGQVQSRWKRRGSVGKRGTEMYLSDEWQAIKTQLAGGRLIVTLGTGRSGGQKTFGVAFLVLSTFDRLPTDGEVARHYLNPNPMNCKITNLKWGSRRANAEDIVRHAGKYHSSKLTPEQVLEIKETLKDNAPGLPGKRRRNQPHKAIAAIYGVSDATIRGIEKGTSQTMVLNPTE